MNKLSLLECIENWKKDNPYPMLDDVLFDNADLYEDIKPCANLFADGSYQYGRAEWGFLIDDDHGR